MTVKSKEANFSRFQKALSFSYMHEYALSPQLDWNVNAAQKASISFVAGIEFTNSNYAIS